MSADSAAPMPKVSQKRKGLLAAELLLRIIRENYVPGDKLPPERHLARDLGVSRNTLREAIAALSLAGLLDLRQSSGNFVLPLADLKQARETVRGVFSDSLDLFAILDARIAFEPGIARMACGTATQKDFDAMRAQLDILVDALACGNAAAYSSADREFHLSMARATHNALIVRTLRPLLDPLHTPLWTVMKGGIDGRESIIDGRIQQHTNIYFALYNRDADLVEELLRKHLRLSKTRLLGQDEG